MHSSQCRRIAEPPASPKKSQKQEEIPSVRNQGRLYTHGRGGGRHGEEGINRTTSRAFGPKLSLIFDKTDKMCLNFARIGAEGVTGST